MITLLDKTGSENTLKYDKKPHLTVRIQSLLKAYGNDYPFFQVWSQKGKAFNLIASLEGSLTVYAEDPNQFDAEEAAFFIKNTPNAQTVSGEAGLIEKIVAFLPGSREEYNVMVQNQAEYSSVKEDSFTEFTIEKNPPLMKIYFILETCKGKSFSVGEFELWYVDFSHRIRHGCADCYITRVKNTPAGCCLVPSISGYAGLISGVATLSEYRNKGIATASVLKVCGELTESGKLPVVECVGELDGFYKKMGFHITDKMSVLTLKNIK